LHFVNMSTQTRARCTELTGVLYSDPLYPAWILKETVLKHQRESAKRTLIFDDQADHHGAQNSEWLTKNEQEDVEIEQAARFERLHQRKNAELKFT
jgi:hypothetical protein